MKNSERNRSVLENFILHITHCSDTESDINFKDKMTFTPEILYKAVDDYILNDHVDGEGGDSLK